MTLEEIFDDGRKFQRYVSQITSIFEMIRDSRDRDTLRDSLLNTAERTMRDIHVLTNKYAHIDPAELRRVYAMYSAIASEDGMKSYSM